MWRGFRLLDFNFSFVTLVLVGFVLAAEANGKEYLRTFLGSDDPNGRSHTLMSIGNMLLFGQTKLLN